MTESESETLRHIRRVQELLAKAASCLIARARIHDMSKLQEPEASIFESCTARLRGITYGSDEYKACLAEMKPAIDHHYAHNRHHPEHWSGGIRQMTLLDLLEMLIDWKAATERHADGSIRRSLEINQKRFGYGDELASILSRSVDELFPESREPWHCFGCGSGGMTGNYCEMCGAGKNDYSAKATTNPMSQRLTMNSNGFQIARADEKLKSVHDAVGQLHKELVGLTDLFSSYAAMASTLDCILKYGMDKPATVEAAKAQIREAKKMLAACGHGTPVITNGDLGEA